MPATETASAPRARLRLSIGAAVVLGLVVLSGAVGLGIMRGQAQPTQTVQIDASDGEVTAGGELYVHVLGQVSHPGLYVLEPDARVVDALAAAGGTLDDADLQAVNLARLLSDGEQLVVPVAGAVEDGGGSEPVGDGLIDLNNADQAALETLPRIGPAIAQRIIDWRETNGRFGSVDDLLAVPGIGEKLLAGLRDLVRV
ncbi:MULTISPECIES: ComEA family DNA-binding protein [unclassified Microbacterium]|uniref:helix-hairpin-helix domain-containing protein n=1 Tax=unclassified Microbacterium TaxID=2609290 RepID=UPI001E475791|nr:ComEA family DNA-binding protein [Microbacterium sp. Bi121]